MNTKAIILILAGVLVLCGASAAKKLHVPGQYATIQAGIDAAVGGDTVIVADGIYTGEGNRDIDFVGKAITVQSENGAENCIIDCNGTEAERHRGFRFGNNEDANSVVDGFTIINGYAPEELFGDDWDSFGGALFCTSSSPTVNNCVMTGNTARGGAGIFCEDSAATLNNCTVSMNHGTGRAPYGDGIMCFDGNSTINNCTVNGNEGGGIHCGRGNPVITNCTASYNLGLGISCGSSNPTIAKCTITGNSNEYSDGAGIALYYSSGTVTDCNISYNTNTEWDGGGIILRGSSTTISKCIITGNSTAGLASAIYCQWFGNPTITDCVIRGNYSHFGGAVIRCDESDAKITNCTISANFGGGVWSFSSRPVISNCTITMNQGPGIGGDGASGTIMNCIVSGNSGYRGGGILWYGGWGTTTIANCTINGNKAEHDGGGVWCSHHSNMVLTNCILWGNTAGQGNQIAVGSPQDDPDESTLTITYSDAQGGKDDAYVKPGSELNWGIGNIDSDPWFVEPGFWDANGVWVEGDYHLLEGSPCIDSGDPNYAAGPNETDLDGKARVIDGDEDGVAVVDMGAYEYVPPTEVEMTLVPKSLNCAGRGKWVKAHITLPEGFSAEDVDVDEPAVAEPMDVGSEYIKVIGDGEGPVMLEIGFEREAFCEAAAEGGEVEVTVVGWLADGREFYGTDTISVIDKGKGRNNPPGKEPLKGFIQQRKKTKAQ